jgi:hypothetical protein
MADGRAGVRLELDLQCAARDSIYFDADSDRILQVLTNLLSNAIKFSPLQPHRLGADRGQIRLAAAQGRRSGPRHPRGQAGGRLRPLPAGRVLGRQQEGRHRAWASPSAAASSSSMAARSGRSQTTPGPGTTLWVQLSRSARASDSTGRTSAIALPAERGEGLILVCDDDPGIRVVVAEQLRQHGYDILEAGSGEEVIAMANEQTAQAARALEPRTCADARNLGHPAGSLHAGHERLGDAAAAEGVARNCLDSRSSF